MGIPVMIVQPDGEAADIVRAANAGEWVAPEDPVALANAVLEWQADKAKCRRYASNSAKAAREHSRERLARDMYEILKLITPT